VSNKAFDLEVTVEELEEMEANEPARPLLVTKLPFTPSPKPRGVDLADEQSVLERRGNILRVIAASFLFLSILYVLSLATYNEPTGDDNATIKEVLRKLRAPMGGEGGTTVAGKEEMRGQLAEEVTKELRKEIQMEVRKQMRGFHREMLD
jgi:hypothetical protein